MNAMQNAFNAVGCILLLGSVGAGAYLNLAKELMTKNS